MQEKFMNARNGISSKEIGSPGSEPRLREKINAD